MVTATPNRFEMVAAVIKLNLLIFPLVDFHRRAATGELTLLE